MTATLPQLPITPVSDRTRVNEVGRSQDVDAPPPGVRDDPEVVVQTDPPTAAPTRRDDDVPEPLSVPVVRMLPSAVEVEVGDRVSVMIEISGATDLGHVPFHITMDPQVLQFEYGEEGNFLRSDGRQTAFFAAATRDASVVVVGLSRLRQGDGIHGGGDLCVLYFNAVGSGDARLGFARAKVRDSSNRIVPAEFLGTAIVVR